MTASVALGLGAAVCRELGRRVAVAVDGRASGPMLEHALVAGVAAMGGAAVRFGRLPTPALALLVAQEGYDAGVMITASHNPPRDNGLKVFDARGNKAGATLRERLESAIAQGLSYGGLAGAQDLVGTIEVRRDAGEAYVQRLLGLLSATTPLRAADRPYAGCTIALDAANGAGFEVGHTVLERLGAKVVRVDGGDGAHINEGCGALHPERLAHAVRLHEADVGIALDGDGDRVALVDGRGRLLDGDSMLWVGAQDLAGTQARVVVGTVMTNAGLERALGGLGISLVRAPVGDAEVHAAMRAAGAQLGGEPSGHLLYVGGPPSADGLYAALRTIGAEPRTLADRAAGYRPHAQAHRTVTVGAVTLPTIPSELVASLEASGARVVVRPSGTEPVVRILVEHADREVARRGADDLHAALSVSG